MLQTICLPRPPTLSAIYFLFTHRGMASGKHPFTNGGDARAYLGARRVADFQASGDIYHSLGTAFPSSFHLRF